MNIWSQFADALADDLIVLPDGALVVLLERESMPDPLGRFTQDNLPASSHRVVVK